MKIRRAEERGQTDWGWLDSQHTFSFGSYYDPDYMGFRSLRVINDDRVGGGAGFDAHSHRDMEILTYVLEGALEHQDSSGGGGVIRPGEIQLMRAGRGITHSEFNHSEVEPVHFLQIWIEPDTPGLTPTYAKYAFDCEAARRGFVLLASRDGRDGSLQVQQEVDLRVSLIDRGVHRECPLRPESQAWIHVARGTVSVNGTILGAGDGAAVAAAEGLSFLGRDGAEVLVFDLA